MTMVSDVLLSVLISYCVATTIGLIVLLILYNSTSRGFRDYKNKTYNSVSNAEYERDQAIERCDKGEESCRKDKAFIHSVKILLDDHLTPPKAGIRGKA